MRPLRLRRPQKRPTGGHVAEELVHFDRRAKAAPFGHHLAHASTVHRQAGSCPVRSARPDHETGHFANAREGLSAKPERLDVFEILRHSQLARGMGRHGKWQIVGLDAAAVIHHPNQRDPTLFERHIDPRGRCIERIL